MEKPSTIVLGFFEALYSGDLARVGELLQQNKELANESQDDEGMFPLIWASQSGDVEAVRVLSQPEGTAEG
jgi:ankyrin repeat protein